MNDTRLMLSKWSCAVVFQLLRYLILLGDCFCLLGLTSSTDLSSIMQVGSMCEVQVLHLFNTAFDRPAPIR